MIKEESQEPSLRKWHLTETQKSNSIESGGKWHEKHSRPKQKWVAHVQRSQGKRVWRVSTQRKPLLLDSVMVGRGRQMPDYTE